MPDFKRLFDMFLAQNKVDIVGLTETFDMSLAQNKVL